MSSETKTQDWTKPAAMAIPQGGYSRTGSSRDDTGLSFPRPRPATASRS